MKYPMSKYKIIVHEHPVYAGKEIIAISTYAGQWVKGKAICHSDDAYKEEKGIKLAVARCAEKIAEKRKARADMLLKKAYAQLEEAKRYVAKMEKYSSDAADELKEACSEVNQILSEM